MKCLYCNKVRYDIEKDAINYKNGLEKKSKNEIFHVYFCEFCLGYHIGHDRKNYFMEVK